MTPPSAASVVAHHRMRFRDTVLPVFRYTIAGIADVRVCPPRKGPFPFCAFRAPLFPSQPRAASFCLRRTGIRPRILSAMLAGIVST